MQTATSPAHIRSIPARRVGSPVTNAPIAGDSLTDLATRLARLHGWLTAGIAARHRHERVPLSHRAAQSRERRGPDSARRRDGESYDLVLRRDASIAVDRIAPRWVYVLAIDSYGRGIRSSFLGTRRQPSADRLRRRRDGAGRDHAATARADSHRAAVRRRHVHPAHDRRAD